jgi:hypothetical protein
LIVDLSIRAGSPPALDSSRVPQRSLRQLTRVDHQGILDDLASSAQPARNGRPEPVAANAAQLRIGSPAASRSAMARRSAADGES